MIKYFAILLLLQLSQQRCLNGCLRCSKDYRCLYCDIQNGYQLREGRCYQIERESCLMRNEFSECMSCVENFYLDLVTLNCVPLDDKVKVENCQVHEGPRVCRVCKPQYFLKLGGCLEISNPIENCEIENERAKCEKCQKGYIRSLDKQSCLLSGTVDGCLSYSEVQCRGCSSGYLRNENYYLHKIFGFTRISDFRRLNQYQYDIKENNVNARQYKTCQKTDITNCMIYDTFEKCKKCSNGFYVNKDMKCEVNPQPVIDHCQRYNTVSSCISCDQGYFLKSKTECEEVIPIENCFLYQNNTPATKCSRCYTDFYLSAENLCSKRTDLSNIPLCEVLSQEFEKCSKCQDSFIPTTDGFRCLAEIEYCSTYQESDKQSIRMECQACENGYFYDSANRLCLKGEIDFCLTYQQNQNKCSICQPQFYLIGNNCHPHKQLNSCLEYSSSNKDQCKQCDSHNFLFQQKDSCFKVDVVPNCQKQGEKSTCLMCDDGHYLKGALCYKIPLEENCLQKTNSNCTKCISSYYLHQGRCVKFFEYYTHGCEEHNADGMTSHDKVGCEKCKKNYVPFNLKDTFVCMDRKTVKDIYIPNKNKIINYGCEQMIWDSVNQKLLCRKCKKGLFLNGDNCYENCVDNTKLTVYRQWVSFHNKTGKGKNDSFRIEKTNVCEKTIDNCAIAQIDINQNFEDIRYSCEKCVNGYLPVVDPQLGGVVRRERDTMRYSPLSAQPSVMCVEVQSSQVIGHKPNSFIEFCEYYHQLIPSVFGCLKCMKGYTGQTVQLIENCEVFDNEMECNKCQQGYYKKTNQECRPVQRIAYCEEYSQTNNSTLCDKCESEYFYNAGLTKCVARDNSLNKTNCLMSQTSDACICIANYVPFQNDCIKLPDNCTSHSTIVNSIPICQVCDSSVSYLMTGGVCAVGTIPNCSVYKAGSDECDICNNGYYKSGKFCLGNTSSLDQFCDDFDRENKNTCKTCKAGATKFQKLNECQAVTNVDPNCEEYLDKHKCKECKTNYYLNNISKRCLIIPSATNCLDMEVVELNTTGIDISDYLIEEKYLHTCNKCKEHYFRRATQVRITRKGETVTQDLTIFTCEKWLNYMKDNCQETDINGLVNMGNGGCYGCKTTFFPYDWINKYICVHSDYLRERKNGFIHDVNCERYDYASSQITCSLCKFPYFYDSSIKECALTCSGAGESPVLFDIDTNNVIERNVCKTVTGAVPNCKYHVKGHAWDTPGTGVYGCYQCDDTHITELQSATASNTQVISLFNPFDGHTDIKFNNDYFPTVTCTNAFTTTNIRGVVNSDGKIDNCSVYYEVLVGTNYGCLRCKQGYRGRVLFNQGDAAGYLESCEVFDECDTELGGLTSNVNLQTSFHPLSSLISCQKCKDGKKLVSFFEFTDAVDVTGFVGLNQFRINFAKDDASTEIFKETTQGFVPPQDLYQQMCIETTNFKSATAIDTALFFETTPAPTVLLPDKCAIYAVNILSKGTFNDTKVPIGCLACEAGYKIEAYNAGDFPIFINTCTAITVDSQTCPTQTDNAMVLNNCDCVRKIDPTTSKLVIDNADKSNECVKLVSGANQNCFAGEMVGTTLKCHICRPGSELAPDNTCYKVSTPSCQAENVNYWDNFNEKILLKGEFIMQYGKLANEQQQAGCLTCTDSDHVLYKIVDTDDNLDLAVCSQELQFVTATTLFSYSDDTKNYFLDNTNNTSHKTISNCVRYGYKNKKYICVQCTATSHFLTEDYQCAVVATETYMQNCKVGKTIGSSVCVECDTGYINVGGLCRDKTDANDKYIDINCDVYASETTNNYKGICSKCKAGYYASNLVIPYNVCKVIPTEATNCKDYLDHTGCINCQDGYGLIDIKLDRYQNKQKRICVKMDYSVTSKFDHDPNCEQFVGIGDPFGLRHQRIKCQKCYDNFVLVNNNSDINYLQRCYNIVPLISECKSYDSPLQQDITTALPDEIKEDTFRCLTCNDSTTHYLDDVQNNCLSRSNITNCDSYDVYYNRCISCEIGYKLKQDGSECISYIKQQTLGYMDTCRQLEDCSGEFYEGLSFQFHTAFSCHKCTESNQIPFASGLLELKEDVEGFEFYKTPIQYKSNFTPSYTLSHEKESQNRCIEPINTSFNLSTSQFVFPDNCGLGFIDFGPIMSGSTHDASQSTQTTIDRTKTTIRCAACKPGYKPTRPTTTINNITQELHFMVSSCTVIPNCESSVWFNQCSQCDPGFTFGYDEGKGILFDECVSVTNNKYCESFDTSNSRCVYCKKGSIMNADGFCEQVNPFKCKYQEFMYRGLFEQKDLEKGVFTDFVVGCNQCEEGYVAMLVENNKDVCLFSPYHSNNSLATITFYIKNCKHYKPVTEGGFVCEQCETGFVPSQTGDCFPNTNLSNCEISSTSTLCDYCIDGFVLVNRKCVSETIPNCKKYSNNRFKSQDCKMCTDQQQLCIQCEGEYYLDSNKCVKGKIDNCSELETAETCNKCEDNFQLVNMQGGRSYCYPIDNRFNCETFKNDKFQSQVLECSECSEGYVKSLSQTDRSTKTCMKFDITSNCLRYNNNEISLANSSFECLECEKNYFLEDSLCKQRINMPDECLSYNFTQDECLECEVGYFLSNTGTQCTPYPQGIYGCEVYRAQTVCGKCQVGFYLQNELCNAIEVPLSNCRRQLDAISCYECDDTYMLFKDSCQLAEAADCASYRSVKECDTCNPGFVLQLQETTSIVNCVQSTVASCLLLDDIAPFKCLKCEGNNYPSEGVCQAVTNIIKNCAEYKSGTECAMCNSRTALSKDFALCLENPEIIENLDLNCSDSVITKEPICNTCMPGYVFSYGECIKCDEKIMNDGCYQCDPNYVGKCVLCQEGFVQTPEGDCVRPFSESQGIEDSVSI